MSTKINILFCFFFSIFQILQLEAVDDSTVISSSLDQTIAVWSAVDGKLKFHMK